MQTISLNDFLFTFLLVGVIGGIAAQVFGGIILQAVLDRKKARETIVESNKETTRIFTVQYFRMLLYYIVSFSVLLVTLLLWTSFWTPLLNASIIAKLSFAYQVFIPTFSALLFAGVGNYVLYPFLSTLINYEARQNKVEYSREKFNDFYRDSVEPYGIVSCATVIIEGCLVGFKFIDISPSQLMTTIYFSVFIISTIWMILLFLLKKPLLLQPIKG